MCVYNAFWYIKQKQTQTEKEEEEKYTHIDTVYTHRNTSNDKWRVVLFHTTAIYNHL